MKKISILILFTCCFLSCSKDDDDINPLVGRWYYEQIIYTSWNSESMISSTGNFPGCEADSHYNISGNYVELTEFLSCEKWNIFQGTFNSEKNQITIANSKTESSVYDVQLEKGKLILRNTTTSIYNNELWTHTITQICVRRPAK
ncbi:MAG: hypothetical protein ACI7YS_10460 [Flavobacterium sp.]